MALKPAVKWAQREDLVFITIQSVNVVDEVITLTANKLSFTGKAGPEKKEYAVDLEFHGEVVPEESTRLINTSKLFFSLKKKDDGYWPRLLNSKDKVHWLKIDFDKWKDEDDDDSENEAKPDNYNAPGMEGFDMEAMMKQMGGGGGPGGGPGGGAGGMPDMAELMKQMGGAGGAGGMPDMSKLMTGANSEQPADADDEPDSDDEDMPGLE